jgi:hypothetical protein
MGDTRGHVAWGISGLRDANRLVRTVRGTLGLRHYRQVGRRKAPRRRAPVAPGRRTEPANRYGLSRPPQFGVELPRRAAVHAERLPAPCASDPKAGREPEDDGFRRQAQGDRLI